nr:MAG: protein app1-like [Penaeus semisulcatus pemonivirus]
MGKVAESQESSASRRSNSVRRNVKGGMKKSETGVPGSRYNLRSHFGPRRHNPKVTSATCRAPSNIKVPKIADISNNRISATVSFNERCECQGPIRKLVVDMLSETARPEETTASSQESAVGPQASISAGPEAPTTRSHETSNAGPQAPITRAQVATAGVQASTTGPQTTATDRQKHMMMKLMELYHMCKANSSELLSAYRVVSPEGFRLNSQVVGHQGMTITIQPPASGTQTPTADHRPPVVGHTPPTSIGVPQMPGHQTPIELPRTPVAGTQTTTTVDRPPMPEQHAPNAMARPSIVGHQTPNAMARPSVVGNQTPNGTARPPMAGHQTPNAMARPSMVGHQTPNATARPPMAGNQTPNAMARPSMVGHQTPNATARPAMAGHQTPNAMARPPIVQHATLIRPVGIGQLSLTPASHAIAGCWDPVASPPLQLMIGRAVLSAIRDTGHFRMYARSHTGNP